MERSKVIACLKEYDGPTIKIMEVCGTHTASIFKHGIPDLLSPNIKLISGPGCPVCVTPTAFIDKCISYAQMDKHVLLTFGDMMKVPGSKGSLSDYKGTGAKVEIMYSPFEAVQKAKAHPETTHIIAAVGFETTAPAYALVAEETRKQNISNIKFVTAIKTIIPALHWICQNQKDIDAFLCPGHVSTVIGSNAYAELTETYQKPFVVAGFEGEHILAAIYEIVRQLKQKKPQVKNLYPNAVKPEGNLKVLKVLEDFFEPGAAMWRGLGVIPNSALYLKNSSMDGGSRGLDQDIKLPAECCCGQVIMGKINPNLCPMFGQACTPQQPFGPCMVSAEGACGIWYKNRNKSKK